MFARTTAVVTSLLYLSVLAAALPSPQGDIAPVCSTGTVSCCNQIAPASQVPLAQLLPLLLALNIQDANVPVGLECTPLSVLGGATAGNWYVLCSYPRSLF